MCFARIQAKQEAQAAMWGAPEDDAIHNRFPMHFHPFQVTLEDQTAMQGALEEDDAKEMARTAYR